jgi:hypothetical protein
MKRILGLERVIRKQLACFEAIRVRQPGFTQVTVRLQDNSPKNPMHGGKSRIPGVIKGKIDHF